MEHLILKATTVAADEGTFEAVISTASMDREGDIVEPAAMVTALQKWATIGKLIPLAWNHTDEVIGHIDPSTARVNGIETIAKGYIDQTITRGAEAWRLVKSGTLSFSFGFLATDDSTDQLPGGRYRFKAVDVYEISVIPVLPANNDTRVLSYKSLEELRKKTDQVERDLIEGNLPDLPDPEPHPMVEAFKGFDPAGKTPVEIANELDGLNLAGDLLHVRLITEDEDAAIKAGLVKAVWTAAYINDLPDSAFLYIESGGSKDSEGKTTPRSLRHFPVKDASGNIDMPHLRNALSRIPQSNLPQDVKDRCTAKAQRMLDSTKSMEAADKGTRSRSADPLRERVQRATLDVLGDGLDLRSPPKQTAEIKATPELDPDTLRRHSRDLMIQILSGVPNEQVREGHQGH